MTIAELFVSIGVKGAEKATEGLGKVKEGMGGIVDSSLAAKAAVLAVVYGLQKLTMLSADTGMELQRFGNLTGLSTDKLQRWQFAMRQTGVSADETAGTIKGVQSAIAQMQLGKGPPGGIGIIAQYTGGFDRTKINDTFYVMDKLRQFAQNKNVPTAFGNEFLKSFGVGENAIQGLRSMTTDLDKVKPSFIYSPAEIARLAKIQVMWENLFAEMKMFAVRLGGTFGPTVIKGLTDAFHLFQHIVKSLQSTGKGFGQLKIAAIALGVAIAYAFAPVTTIIAGILFGMSEIQKFREGKQTVSGKFLGDVKNEVGKGLDWAKSGRAGDDILGFLSTGLKNLDKAVAPNAPAMALAGGPAGPQQSITQNITHYGDAKDTKGVANLHKHSIKNAALSLSSQKQVN